MTTLVWYYLHTSTEAEMQKAGFQVDLMS